MQVSRSFYIVYSSRHTFTSTVICTFRKIISIFVPPFAAAGVATQRKKADYYLIGILTYCFLSNINHQIYIKSKGNNTADIPRLLLYDYFI